MTNYKRLFPPLGALLLCIGPGCALTGCGMGSTTASPSAASLPATNGVPNAGAALAAATVTTANAPTDRGAAQFTIHWPQQGSAAERRTQSAQASARTRLIPLAANSIRVELQEAANPASIVSQIVVARPLSGQNTSLITLPGLPSTALIAVASAYPNTDGTGVAQATGTVPLTIRSNQTTAVDLQMNSTIATLRITPAIINAAANSQVGVTVSGLDATGALVLLPTSGTTITYAIDKTDVATVNGAGSEAILTSRKAGTATLTVTDTESGKSAQAAINIVLGAGNVIVPVN